jgi:hypothetical protein
MNPETQKSLTTLRDEAYENAKAHGFHDVGRTVGDAMMLFVQRSPRRSKHTVRVIGSTKFGMRAQSHAVCLARWLTSSFVCSISAVSTTSISSTLFSRRWLTTRVDRLSMAKCFDATNMNEHEERISQLARRAKEIAKEDGRDFVCVLDIAKARAEEKKASKT